jgi:hypothetical protein
MEHASIAAFGRFALELVALGAPSWALGETALAMGDETAHAEMAFALASAYAGHDVGPAPLPIDGALGEVNERSVFATLVREGCIGETLAAVLAAHALEEATDTAVRDVLVRIVADETRHAALAWRVAMWLVARGDDAFRSWARHDLETAVAERLASTYASESERILVRSALRDVVLPCAKCLVSSNESHQHRTRLPVA